MSSVTIDGNEIDLSDVDGVFGMVEQADGRVLILPTRGEAFYVDKQGVRTPYVPSNKLD